MTTVLYRRQLIADLEQSTLFLDTNVFSAALRNTELTGFLIALRGHNCALVTIPSVQFEVTRGSDTLRKYNDRAQVVNEIVTYIDPMSFQAKLNDFSVVMAKHQQPKNSQYTDFLLAACLYFYRKSASKTYVMTSDLLALPKVFFDREHVITSVHENEIKNFGIFSLNNARFEEKLNAIYAESNT